VILSQIVRGAAEELASRPGELIDPILVSAAFARAADAAYESVREPAEGTMLSAVRAMAHRVAQDLAHMEPQRLGAGVAPEEQDRLLAEVLERALEAGNEAVRRGPEQLAVLREAGVVDAGAYGLTVIVAGVIAALRGDDAAPELEHHTAPARDLHLPQHEDSRYRYCTNFVVTGEGLDSHAVVPLLEGIGDSVLVVGDPKTLKVHVHTDEPDLAVGIFLAQDGEVSRLDVADMREQVAERAARLAAGGGSAPDGAVATCGAVVVANGPGIVEMYRGLGAHVVDGGATLNPSTYDILAGIHAVPAAEAIVLPNSPNVILAAERAAELSEKPARVVPTRAQQAGLTALLAFDASLGAEENETAIADAAAGLTTGGVAFAARDDASGRFAAGDAVGYAGEELIAWGAPDEVLRTVLAAVCDGAELVTCISGEGAPLDAGAVETLVPDGVELDLHEGGQPSWWWLLAAE
jgi:DAK2 domain fusion protein YloV